MTTRRKSAKRKTPAKPKTPAKRKTSATRRTRKAPAKRSAPSRAASRGAAPTPDLLEMLARLQSVGLFRGATPTAFARAMTHLDVPRPHFEEDGEQPSLERALPPEAIELLAKTNPGLLLHHPMGAASFNAVIAALPDPPAALVGPAPSVTVRDVRRGLLRLEVDGEPTTYEAATFAQLTGVFNQALECAGDDRCFVLLHEEHDVDRFLLATPEQRTVLAELGLGDVELYGAPVVPEPFVPQVVLYGRVILGGRERAEEAAAVFRLGDAVPERAGLFEAFPDEQPIYGDYPRRPGLALVVVKGYGGQASGDIACDLVLEALGEGFATLPPAEPAARRDWLGKIVRAASEHLRASATGRPLGERPGERLGSDRLDEAATMIWGGGGASIGVAVVIDDALLVAHAGDVRVTLRRAEPIAKVWCARDLVPLTEDDSLPVDLAGPEPGQHHDGVVTRALGFSDDVTVSSHRLGAGDVLHLTSHGLRRAIPPERLEQVMTREAPGHWNLILAGEASRAAKGNATGLVALVREDDRAP